jgi:hypothetical protein
MNKQEIFTVITVGGEDQWDLFNNLGNPRNPGWIKVIDPYLQFAKMEIESVSKKIGLIKTTPLQMGFKDVDVPYNEIIDRAQHLKLKVCPQETGLRLAGQYNCLLPGESLHIISQPIPYQQDNQSVYCKGIILTRNEFGQKIIETYLVKDLEYCVLDHWANLVFTIGK